MDYDRCKVWGFGDPGCLPADFDDRDFEEESGISLEFYGSAGTVPDLCILPEQLFYQPGTECQYRGQSGQCFDTWKPWFLWDGGSLWYSFPSTVVNFVQVDFLGKIGDRQCGKLHI